MTNKEMLRYIAITVLAMPIDALAQPSALVPSGANLTVPFAFGNKRVPVWGGNALLVADGPVVSPNIFMAFNREGRRVFSSGFSIPGASNTSVRSFAIGADGVVALCGVSYASDGRGAPFIALLSADGNSQHVTRTEPYTANLIAVAPDGTLWTVGRELNPDASEDSGVNLNAGVLRHFDQDGKSLGAFIPRSSIQDPTHLSTSKGQLAAGADRVGWLHCDHTGQGAYVEISSDGKNASFPLPQLPNLRAMRVGGLAITDAGDVFAEVNNQDGKTSFSVFVLSRSAGRWLPVKIPASGKWALLLGSTGNELAFNVPGDSYSTIHFFAPDKK